MIMDQIYGRVYNPPSCFCTFSDELRARVIGFPFLVLEWTALQAANSDIVPRCSLPQGPTRTVRLPGAAASGRDTIAKTLRILRVSDSQTSLNPDHKSSVGRGGHRIDALRNLWTGSGLKMESVSTDVAWGRGSHDNKIPNECTEW
ncbi:hypothetical protein BJV78DRAFT_761024 [Lactifluus subvellereus]|nr:hypothetical protein BJV78DRAFT_761024 [Lactifluus subvellereus]